MQGLTRKYGILFLFNLFCEYANFAFVRVPVVYRVHQKEYGIHILVVASQEYVIHIQPVGVLAFTRY